MTAGLACRALRPSVPQPRFSPRTLYSDRRESMRRRALKELDKTIDSNDLSATLEAHRDANRASLIRRVNTIRQDPEIIRPTFLDQRPPIRLNPVDGGPSAKQHLEEQPPAISSQIHPDTTLSHADKFSIKRLKTLAERDERERASRKRNGQINATKHRERADFLAKYEHPPAPIPEYKSQDHEGFFQVIRRCHAVIRAEQKKNMTTSRIATANKNILDYVGMHRNFVQDVKGYDTAEPWNRRPQVKGYLAKTWLETEIQAFAEWMEMTPAEDAARKKVADDLIQVIGRAAPNVTAEAFGSQTTGLTMPNSDIDIRIYEPEHRVSPPPEVNMDDKEARRAYFIQLGHQKKERVTLELRKIQAHLQKNPDYDEIELQEAHYPLVSAVHVPSGLKVQLVGTRSSKLSREAILKYLAEYPNLKTLYTLTKTILDLRGLTNPWNGGFGSYPIFMMCVAALKLDPREHSDAKPRQLAGEFLQILYFWAHFDTFDHCIAIEPPMTFPKKVFPTREDIKSRESDPLLYARIRIAQPQSYKRYLPAIQDPADRFNDLGRSGLAIRDLQATFNKLHRDLSIDLVDPNRRLISRPLLRPLVGRCDALFDEMRIKVELWGAQLLEDGVEFGDVGEAQETVESPLEPVNEPSLDTISRPQ